MINKKFILKLKGKTAVFIDWANAYNWKDSLKWEIDLKKLFQHLKSYVLPRNSKLLQSGGVG